MAVDYGKQIKKQPLSRLNRFFASKNIFHEKQPIDYKSEILLNSE